MSSRPITKRLNLFLLWLGHPRPFDGFDHRPLFVCPCFTDAHEAPGPCVTTNFHSSLHCQVDGGSCRRRGCPGRDRSHDRGGWMLLVLVNEPAERALAILASVDARSIRQRLPRPAHPPLTAGRWRHGRLRKTGGPMIFATLISLCYCTCCQASSGSRTCTGAAVLSKV